MRAKVRLLRDALVLWLAGFAGPWYALAVLTELLSPKPFSTWKGATPGWSPRSATAAVGGPAAWDVGGWLDSSTTNLHKHLNGIEDELHSQLDRLLAMVYEWRDAA